MTLNTQFYTVGQIIWVPKYHVLLKVLAQEKFQHGIFMPIFGAIILCQNFGHEILARNILA